MKKYIIKNLIILFLLLLSTPFTQTAIAADKPLCLYEPGFPGFTVTTTAKHERKAHQKENGVDKGRCMPICKNIDFFSYITNSKGISYQWYGKQRVEKCILRINYPYILSSQTTPETPNETTNIINPVILSPQPDISIATNNATDITATTATLYGSVSNTGATPTLNLTAYFRYSPSPIAPVFCNDIYGSNMKSTKDILLSKTPYAFFHQSISNLTPDTTYYYCTIVSNKKNIIYGGEEIVKSFHTNCYNTTVNTKEATQISDTSATLNGTYCSTQNVQTAFNYQESWQRTTNPLPIQTVGATDHSVATGESNTSGNFSFKLTGLKPNTTYQFNAVARDATGVINSPSSFDFTTAPLRLGNSDNGFSILDFGFDNFIGIDTGGFGTGFGSGTGSDPFTGTSGTGDSGTGGNTGGGGTGGTGGTGGGGSTTPSDIENQTISNTNISNTTISNITISSGTLGSEVITNIIVSSGNVTNSSVSGGIIGSGFVSNATISDSTITSGTITGGNIGSGTITSGTLSSGIINSGNITSGTITSGILSEGTVVSGTITDGTITGATIITTSGNITNATVSDATITGVTMDDSGNITHGAITSGTITSGIITNSTISNGTISSGTITSGTITSGTTAGGGTTANNGTWGSENNAGGGATSGTWGTGTSSGTWTATTGTGGVGFATWFGSGNGAGTWTSSTGSGTWSNGTGTGGIGTGTWGNLVLGQTAIAPNDAIVRYHEGIETVLTRQILNNPIYTATYGFQTGDDLLTFAWNLSHQFAQMFGYINQSGREIRVSYPDIAAYQLQLIGNKLTVYEYYDNKIVDIRNLTTVFKNASNYEYYFTKN